MSLYREHDKTYVFDTYNRDYKSLSDDFHNKNWIQIKHEIVEPLHDQNCGQECLAWIATVRKYGIKCFYEAYHN